jgi:hypothetical protein
MARASSLLIPVNPIETHQRRPLKFPRAAPAMPSSPTPGQATAAPRVAMSETSSSDHGSANPRSDATLDRMNVSADGQKRLQPLPGRAGPRTLLQLYRRCKSPGLQSFWPRLQSFQKSGVISATSVGNGVTVAFRFLGQPVDVPNVVLQCTSILIRPFPGSSEPFAKPFTILNTWIAAPLAVPPSQPVFEANSDRFYKISGQF